MEWLLQVVDEVDDAIGALRHTWFGINAEFSAFFSAPLRVRTPQPPLA